ncbi:MAG: hypothetical protein Q4E28_01855 [Clostridia bacterium]|nr:hypothetical protein [Clostridia bacterium]
METERYIKRIYDYLNIKNKNAEQISDFYIDIQVESPFSEIEEYLVPFLYDIEDLSEEYEPIEDITKLKIIDIKLIELLKKYNIFDKDKLTKEAMAFYDL